MVESGFVQVNNNLISHSELCPIGNVGGATCHIYRFRSQGKLFILKRLKEEFACNPRYIEAFRKEYEVGRKMHHPNIVEYIEMGEDIDGCYLVLENVEGVTLETKLQDNAQWFAQESHLLRFIYQLLDGLIQLHNIQILHLDLKPDNILITKVSNNVKILDLGCCYSDSFDRTIGYNPVYSAPEQLENENLLSKLDVRADIYAVGRILEDIVSAIGNCSISNNTAFQKVIKKCTSQDRKYRFATVEDLKQAIEYAFTPKKNKRKPLTLSFLALIICLGILGLVKSLSLKGDRPEKLTFRDPLDCTVYTILPGKDNQVEVVGNTIYPLKKHYENMVISSPIRHEEVEYKVVSVRNSAFAEDSLIETLSLPEDLRFIGQQSFSGCKKLQSASLPRTLEVIDHDAFSGCSNLRSIILPPNLKRIGRCAFVGCTNLRNINFPEGLTSISADCFVSCGLQEVILPNTLVSLERGVFYDCKNLQSVTLPSSLQTIGDYCFDECYSLREVKNLSLVPQQIPFVFTDSISKNCRLLVPAESLELYKNAKVWNSFASIEPIPDL